MSLARVTPSAVYDLYLSLSPEDQIAFLKRLGRDASAAVPFQITTEMSLPEKERFTDMVFSAHVMHLFPVLVQHALRIVRAEPDISDPEFESRLVADVAASMAGYNESIIALERAKLKGQRDRKSDPETIRRNVEICDLRKDRKRWSLGKLAKRFGVSARAITLVLSEEGKWRQLAAELGRN